MNFLETAWSWIAVQSSHGYNYAFPSALSAYMREQYCGPRVYRWMVRAPSLALSALYVGETDNLVRRIQHCLSPSKKQATNLRLKEFFDRAAERGERVELETVQFEPFQINKVNFSMDRLGHTHIRRTLENLILAELDAGVSSAMPLVLNRILSQDKERRDKRVGSVLTQLKKLGVTDEQARRLLKM